jgi:transcriptional regulator with XRE-family HTH domain
MAFQDKLRALRVAAGLTQGELAAKAGISLGSVRNLEQGIRSPSWETVQKLAVALDVDCTAFNETVKEKGKS